MKLTRIDPNAFSPHAVLSIKGPRATSVIVIRRKRGPQSHNSIYFDLLRIDGAISKVTPTYPIAVRVIWKYN